MSPRIQALFKTSREFFWLGFCAGFWSRSADITVVPFEAIDSSAEPSAYDQRVYSVC